MTILRKLLVNAARKIAADPRTRAKAADLLENQVKPRMRDAAARARPKIEAARAELKDLAAETDPRRNPAEFAGRLTRRIIDKAKAK